MKTADLLNKLIELAHSHAAAVLLAQKRRELLPTWMLLNAKGEAHIEATPWRDDKEKRLAEIFMKLQMRKHGTVAYSFVTEAWAAIAPEGWRPGQPRTFPEPRKDPTRREMVIALACTADEHRMKSWLIHRNHLEQIFALEEDKSLVGDEPGKGFESWLADLLKKS